MHDEQCKSPANKVKHLAPANGISPQGKSAKKLIPAWITSRQVVFSSW